MKKRERIEGKNTHAKCTPGRTVRLLEIKYMRCVNTNRIDVKNKRTQKKKPHCLTETHSQNAECLPYRENLNFSLCVYISYSFVFLLLRSRSFSFIRSLCQYAIFSSFQMVFYICRAKLLLVRATVTIVLHFCTAVLLALLFTIIMKIFRYLNFVLWIENYGLPLSIRHIAVFLVSLFHFTVVADVFFFFVLTSNIAVFCCSCVVACSSLIHNNITCFESINYKFFAWTCPKICVSRLKFEHTSTDSKTHIFRMHDLPQFRYIQIEKEWKKEKNWRIIWTEKKNKK